MTDDKIKAVWYGLCDSDRSAMIDRRLFDIKPTGKPYSKDISAAWEVRDWVHQNIGGTEIISVCDETPELCRIWDGNEYIEVRGYTASEAICLAALIAKERSK